ITTCKEPGTVAITFDDGPSKFTHTLLDSLKAMDVKATFFINGNNFGCIYDLADVLIRAKREGHQIAHHTWSHPDLATLTKEQIVYQVKKLEEAFLKIIGVVPKFIRPPFGSGVDSDLVMSTLTELGYTAIVWDTDTNDWQGRTTAQSLDVYKKASPPPHAHIVLNHDTIKNTATNMAPKAFKLMQNRKFKITTVGQCLGISDPNKWYQKIQAPGKRDNTWVCTETDKTG
ncbi:Carbohydrate Esterase Family 4 protein, partial [Glomus cerebriforme]